MTFEYLGSASTKVFASVTAKVYRGNRFYRGTEGSIEHLLLSGKSVFSRSAHVKPCVLRDGNDLVARFAFIDDKRQPEHLQMSFFEAHEGLGDIMPHVISEARKHFPHRKKLVAGLNGHLNYGAGILLDRFDEAPVFGLPYSPPYYAAYFKNMQMHKMVSFRFGMDVYSAWAERYKTERTLEGLQLRFMNKKHIDKESAVYTYLNNRAFVQHPFWADRAEAEDLELFRPFRHLLDNENLIFAELDGRPLGFFLWYPDFNELVGSRRDLNVFDVLKYRLGAKIDTFRFTEIGILPEFQRSPVALALISKSLPVLQQRGYRWCEGGFIFEENKASMAFVKRILKRCYGTDPEPYRSYAIFETAL